MNGVSALAAVDAGGRLVGVIPPEALLQILRRGARRGYPSPRFTNHLPEETTIHWHGVRLPASMDGVPEHSQPAVPPGGSFDYSFAVPDSGLFWYHPHVRSAQQVGDGLYGALLVEPAGPGNGALFAGGMGAGDDSAIEPGALGPALVLVLSDIGVAPRSFDSKVMKVRKAHHTHGGQRQVSRTAALRAPAPPCTSAARRS
jgi:hypothetical protein